MAEPSNDPRLNELRNRIEELNATSTRVLIFLAFGLAAIVLLWTTDLLTDLQLELLLGAIRWWALAILPAIAGILPLKEFRENNVAWYNFLRWLKFALLWLAIICVIVGTAYFIRSIFLPPPPSENTQSTMLISPRR